MMAWYIVLNCSILLPAGICITRFRVYGPLLRPYIFLVWLGTMSEALSLVLIYTGHFNCMNGNIYTLLEYGLLLCQFQRWNGARWQPFVCLAVCGLALWFIDNFWWHTVNNNNSLFRAMSSFVVVMLAIAAINHRVIDTCRPVLYDTVFLLCTGFVVYFSAKTFLEIFNLFQLVFSEAFEAGVFWAEPVVNFICNLIFATALLCTPVKRQYSLHS